MKVAAARSAEKKTGVPMEREEEVQPQQNKKMKKEGEADDAPPKPEAPSHIPGRLFVGGLPRDVTPEALSNLLSAFGARVEHVEFNTKHVPILGTRLHTPISSIEDLILEIKC
jgi:RNA recognition motif-containing protein